MLLLLNLSDSYPLRCLSVCQSRKPPKCLIRQRSVFPLLALRRCLVTCYFTPVNVLVAHFFFGCRLSVMSHLCTSAWQTSASVANRELSWTVLKYPQNIFLHFLCLVYFMSKKRNLSTFSFLPLKHFFIDLVFCLRYYLIQGRDILQGQRMASPLNLRE